jgi:putative transposase
MAYPSDLKDKEWKRIEGYFEPRGVGGRKPVHSKRSIVNAVLYVVKSGYQWRMLPKDFPS